MMILVIIIETLFTFNDHHADDDNGFSIFSIVEWRWILAFGGENPFTMFLIHTVRVVIIKKK